MVRAMITAVWMAGVGTSGAHAAEVGSAEPLRLEAWEPRDATRAELNMAYVYDATLPRAQGSLPRRGFVVYDGDGNRLDHVAFARTIGDVERADDIERLRRRWKQGIWGSVAMSSASILITMTTPTEDFTGAPLGASVGLLAGSVVALSGGLGAQRKLKANRYTLEAFEALPAASVADAPMESSGDAPAESSGDVPMESSGEAPAGSPGDAPDAVVGG